MRAESSKKCRFRSHLGVFKISPVKMELGDGGYECFLPEEENSKL